MSLDEFSVAAITGFKQPSMNCHQKSCEGVTKAKAALWPKEPWGAQMRQESKAGMGYARFCSPEYCSRDLGLHRARQIYSQICSSFKKDICHQTDGTFEVT